MPIKGALPYIGNKLRELPFIYEVINTKKDFQIFVDVFGGSGCVAFNIGAEYKRPVILNEINPILIDAYNKYLDLDEYRICNLTLLDIPKNKETFEEYKLNPDTLDKMLYIKFCSFSNLGTSFHETRAGLFNIASVERKIKERTKYEQTIKNMDITIRNEDFRNILNEFHDNENAILYLDPPYINKPDKNYGQSFSLDDLEFIQNYFKTCKCLVMLHIDFTGHIFMNFREHNFIKIYNLEYAMSSPSQAKGKIYKNYHCIIIPSTRDSAN